MNDTPRTDKQLNRCIMSDCAVEFARQLERELADAHELSKGTAQLIDKAWALIARISDKPMPDGMAMQLCEEFFQEDNPE